MKRLIFKWLFPAVIASLFLTHPVLAQQDNINSFFRDFTVEWIRHDPDLAARTRYFSGEEQDRFERELTPLTLAWKRERIQLARKGLAELQKFNGVHLRSEPQRLSAAVMEVERYVVFPGQACSYMLGELKILELRQKAQKALGDKFSLPEFHNQVFEAGTVPLDILEQQVDAYIRRASGKP